MQERVKVPRIVGKLVFLLVKEVKLIRVELDNIVLALLRLNWWAHDGHKRV